MSTVNPDDQHEQAPPHIRGYYTGADTNAINGGWNGALVGFNESGGVILHFPSLSPDLARHLIREARRGGAPGYLSPSDWLRSIPPSVRRYFNLRSEPAEYQLAEYLSAWRGLRQQYSGLALVEALAAHFGRSPRTIYRWHRKYGWPLHEDETG